jgi:phosphate transport system protein
MASAATSQPLSAGELALVNYLVAMARTVEGSVHKSIEALLNNDDRLASSVFLIEPRINEMEIIIDEHAVRLLRDLCRPAAPPELPDRTDALLRSLVATLRINNDLERMGDLAVNIAQRVTTLAGIPGISLPPELPSMCAAVRVMVTKCLGAIIYRNEHLALEILESDDAVDQYRDRVFESCLAVMTGEPARVAPNVQYVLASRYLERIADHTTNIAEDILFWVRGLEVRHGRGVQALRDRPLRAAGLPEPAPATHPADPEVSAPEL